MDSPLRRRVLFVISLVGLGVTLWLITHPSPAYLAYANSNLGHYVVLPVELVLSAALALSLCHLKSHISDQRDDELITHSLRRFSVVFAMCYAV
ncbi:hypothetical protein RchiOBHm_Chr3g0448561 [Rosa chinensis]|uniref:Uncharacterized protein n=1 Tax=Rosa chinensis TaxID=74649 RepID=A0A2P6R5D7_ROSCH|nr:hypothetical protein RchiOBHm_Chr3g0448561 [Rosa chinensis]